MNTPLIPYRNRIQQQKLDKLEAVIVFGPYAARSIVIENKDILSPRRLYRKIVKAYESNMSLPNFDSSMLSHPSFIQSKEILELCDSAHMAIKSWIYGGYKIDSLYHVLVPGYPDKSWNDENVQYYIPTVQSKTRRVRMFLSIKG